MKTKIAVVGFLLGLHFIGAPLFAETNELDAYLQAHGFYLAPNGVVTSKEHLSNEGYMTNAQKRQFSDELRRHQHIRTILEIGLNGGHSAYHFIQSCKNFEKFVSFDVATNSYTPCAVEFFKQKYGSRFEFVKGNSLHTLPNYIEAHPNETFDLIYIDGSHEYEILLSDVTNCNHLAHQNTVVWIDDYTFPGPQRVLWELIHRGVIERVKAFTSEDPCGGRSWIQIRYRKTKQIAH
jgi:predicted O-methyltransferase YrrM